MLITYIGSAPERTIDFPVPFLAEASREGSIRFLHGEPTEVKPEWAYQLLAVAGIDATFVKSEPKEAKKAVKA